MSADFDFAASVRYNDAEGLRAFALAHRFDHNAIASAISQTKQQTMPTFDVIDEGAIRAWIAVMQASSEGTRRGMPPALLNWLLLHANLHQAEYGATGQGLLPDLATIDFSDPAEFYDWMFFHQEIHDGTKSVLQI